MIGAHTVAQVRSAEAELMAALPAGVLMQRAAHGLAAAIVDFMGGAYGRRVLLLVGSGDNGGDALYAGALLARRGAHVEAWLLSDRAHAQGVAALRSAGGRAVVGEVVSKTTSSRPAAGAPRASTTAMSYDVVVDGIVGIGGRPGLRPDAVAALEAVRGTPIVAVDVPSGVDVDTGEIDGPHVTADLTVTFGTHKACHLADPAAQAAGAIELVDIGLVLPDGDIEALQPADVAALLPRPAPDAHKYTRGVVGVRAGSAAYPGAGLLSVAGAMCGLTGMVRLDSDAAVLDLVHARFPEVVGPGRVQAWVVGSGSDSGAERQLRAGLADGVPVVVDADALQHLRGPVGVPAVLTPHAGELAAMMQKTRDRIEDRPLAWARGAAEEFQCVVLLKGRRSVIAHPDGRTRVNTTGVPGLATAGAGDVLGGLIGALLAAGLTPFDAASVGAWLHGAAATHAAHAGPVVASDVADAVPNVVAALTRP